MIYLLDTHIILWSLYEPEKIETEVRQILENDNDTKMISGVNLWEISLKYALGKLDLGDMEPDSLFDIMIQSGFEVVELDSNLLVTYHQLPRKQNHRDPFDRLLIWQAIVNNFTIITHDEKLEQYRNDGLQFVLSV